jgi:hypothetical protein
MEASGPHFYGPAIPRAWKWPHCSSNMALMSMPKVYTTVQVRSLSTCPIRVSEKREALFRLISRA